MRAVAVRTLASGIKPRNGPEKGEYQARLRNLAELLQRSYAAVRMRASRLQAYSYMGVAQTDIEDQINAEH